MTLSLMIKKKYLVEKVAELEKIGAPSGLVDSTIERYKANPNQ